MLDGSQSTITSSGDLIPSSGKYTYIHKLKSFKRKGGKIHTCHTEARQIRDKIIHCVGAQMSWMELQRKADCRGELRGPETNHVKTASEILS